MKKLKYYAPYCVSAIIIIIIATIVMLLIRVTPFSKLPELAANLENKHYFIREDGVVLKSAGVSATGEALAPYNDELHWVGQLKAKALHEMLPHEYAALISDKKIYLRQDGKVFVMNRNYPGIRKEYIIPICPPSEMPENASIAEWEINAVSEWRPNTSGGTVEAAIPAADMNTGVHWALSVKLKDGWYNISDGMCERIKVDSDGEAYYLLEVPFPALHEGDYRIEVCIGDKWFYRELTLTRKNTDKYTLSW